MRKWMIKFLRKFENRGIKIAQVNSILTKSINLQLFTIILQGIGVRCDRRQISEHILFTEKSMLQHIDGR